MSNCNENQQVIQTEHYRFEAGTKSWTQGNVEISLSTPTQQGINMYKNGNCDFAINGTLHEVSGCDAKKIKPGCPGRIINAKNGDILIQAKNGTITLQAKNIRLVGVDGVEGEISLQASKTCNINSPTVSAQGTNITLASSSKTQVAGAAAASLVGGASAEIQSGTDAESSSVIGRILKALEDFKKFFSSICADKPAG
jgi:hypothetical protein